jgi:hypothetical protein
MSTPSPEHPTGSSDPTPLPPEPDRIPWGMVSVVTVVTLVVFLVGVAWATGILVAQTGWVRPVLDPVPAGIGQATVGIVDQRIFEQELRAEQLMQEQRRRLTGYGWVDRPQQLIHLPVERAMDLILEENR